MKIFVIVFGGIGAILLAIAGLVYMRESSFLSRAELVTGTVIDFSLSTDTDGTNTTYCPVIDFTTKAGQKVKYQANVCSAPAAYQVGDQVQVYYDPQDLKQSQLKSFWAQYVGMLVLSCIGLPFLLFGLSGLFMGKKKNAV